MPVETVAGLGEAGLLARILPLLTGAPMLLGPGDDAAMISAPDGRFVITVDTLVQDQDFRLLWPNGYRSTGYDVGWKSAAQNLSDINAMGAVATSAVISLTLPADTPVAWAEDLASGFAAAVHTLGAHRCALAGGDLGAGRELSVTAALTGSLEGREAVLRSGARPGDTVAVCGNLGVAAAGLALLETGAPHAELGERERRLIALQLRPWPPLSAGPEAALAGATAMMDISDGLGRDAGRLAAASGVVVELNAESVLAVAGRDIGEDATALLWALTGGEDHSLLATFPRGVALPGGFHSIGSCRGVDRAAPNAHVMVDGVALDRHVARLRETGGGPATAVPGEAGGFDHFGG